MEYPPVTHTLDMHEILDVLCMITLSLLRLCCGTGGLGLRLCCGTGGLGGLLARSRKAVAEKAAAEDADDTKERAEAEEAPAAEQTPAEGAEGVTVTQHQAAEAIVEVSPNITLTVTLSGGIS